MRPFPAMRRLPQCDTYRYPCFPAMRCLLFILPYRISSREQGSSKTLIVKPLSASSRIT